jgi:hypothetical protein
MGIATPALPSLTDVAYGLFYVDHRGTTVSGTQQVMPDQAYRVHYFFYNESSSPMHISFGPSDAGPNVGVTIAPSYFWEPKCVCPQRMTVWCGTAGAQYSAGEWL